MGGRIRLLAMGFVEPSALPEWPARTASESLMHRHALLQSSNQWRVMYISLSR
jgi:hypothetical protein